MGPMLRALPLCLLSVSLLGACSDIESYRGDYVGEVAGAVACDQEPCSFIRRGFTGGTTLSLRAFDPSIQTADSSAGVAPGFLTTSDAQCGDGTETLLDEPLRPIAPLAHDALSILELPGSTRVRTYVYALEPERGPLAGRTAMVFVTLLEEQEIEVRVVSGDGAEDCPGLPFRDPPEDECAARAAGTCDFYGLFELDPA